MLFTSGIIVVQKTLGRLRTVLADLERGRAEISKEKEQEEAKRAMLQERYDHDMYASNARTVELDTMDHEAANVARVVRALLEGRLD